MAMAPRLSLVCVALVATAVLWNCEEACASSAWKRGSELVVGVAEAASSGVEKVLEAAGDVHRTVASSFNSTVDEARGIGRQLVEGAAAVASRVSGSVVGGFLEVVGLNKTCSGEADAGCRQVVSQLVDEYLDVTDVTLNSSGLFDALQKRILVHPGTKWCGAGNVARGRSDSGVLAATDACCRNHDDCPDNIAVGEERHGLRNNYTFTRSHCDCDREFYQCLKDADTLVSLKIGIIYFSILRPQCFEETYPIVGCKTKTRLSITPHCTEYDLDWSGERRWQWLDNPTF